MDTLKFLRWQAGGARITRILDVEASGLELLLPNATPENLALHDWLWPYLSPTGDALAAIQSFVIEIGGRRLLVDTGAGEPARALIPARLERTEPYLEELVEAGFAWDSIDTVIHTHLHFDHVGWNLRPTRGGFMPTFSNARHLVATKEWSYWSSPSAREDRAPVAAAIRPLMDVDRVSLVEPGQEVAPGVVLEATPGHTPGHVSVRIFSGSGHALITGDVLHHPAQLAHPEWTCTWDEQPDTARSTRERMLEELAGSGILVLGSHFAHAPAGFVMKDGAQYRFEPCAPTR